MAIPLVKSSVKSSKIPVTASSPVSSVRGAHNSILLEMPVLGHSPASGRLLRGLSPYLDDQGADHVFLLTHRKWREPWSGDPDLMVSYQELVHWERGAGGGIYRGVCARDATLKREEILQAFQYEPLSLIDFAARRMESAVISSKAPLPLEIHHVEKPWGREGWYTGIEKRGLSRVRTSSGSTDLPYALGMFPVPLVGEREVPPILLKTLEPLPEAVYGDLYLEVHREKWETYVVLSLDPKAWPDGEGALRAGLNPKRVEAYRKKHGEKWQKALGKNLMAAIKAYEKVRREIDQRLDKALEKRGEDSQQPLPPTVHKKLLEKIPKKLRASEEEKRAAVEDFLGLVKLKPGDVACLPPGVLHSLQHGVKVIEFQTPTYERLIAMFAQKVLTQPHWDVEEAMECMEMEPYTPRFPEVLEQEDDLLVERVVDFPQFQVERIKLPLNRNRPGRTEGDNRYQLLTVTAGKGEMILPGGDTYSLVPEQAYLLPATMGEYTVNAISAQGVTYLLASPAWEESMASEDKDVSLDEAIDNTW